MIQSLSTDVRFVKKKKIRKNYVTRDQDKNKFHSITIPIPLFDVEDLSKINKTNDFFQIDLLLTNYFSMYFTNFFRVFPRDFSSSCECVFPILVLFYVSLRTPNFSFRSCMKTILHRLDRHRDKNKISFIIDTKNNMQKLCSFVALYLITLYKKCMRFDSIHWFVSGFMDWWHD